MAPIVRVGGAAFCLLLEATSWIEATGLQPVEQSYCRATWIFHFMIQGGKGKQCHLVVNHSEAKKRRATSQLKYNRLCTIISLGSVVD